ncbi:MAG: universal stress protein, partial [Bradymonadaceae bacterium]
MTVLATIDMSDHSETVVDCARRFADLFGTDLQVLHCRPGPDDFWRRTRWDRLTRSEPPDDPERADLEAFVARTVDGQLGHRRVGYRLAAPPLSEAIEEVVGSEQLDLVVLGASHRGRLTKFLLESTPEGVVRQCDFPVIVVPGTMDERRFSSPMLTPIDVDNPHRHSLEYALDLARRADTRLRL